MVEIYDSIPEARESIASSKDEGVDINLSDCIAYGVPKKETYTIANINCSDYSAYDVGPNVNIEAHDAEYSTKYEMMKVIPARK